MAPKDLSFSGLLQSLREKDNNLFSVLYGYFLATVSEKLKVVRLTSYIYVYIYHNI